MRGQPIYILSEGTERQQGKGARSNNIQAGRAIADAARSTLGPRGMDKMLVDSMGDVVITNDGATILDKIDVEHPAAKMVIEVAEAQDQECHDGTTTAVVIAGELLKRAEDLVEDVHPTLITRGYRLAAERALEVLREDGMEATDDRLEHVARTAMASKASAEHADVLAPIAVRAVQAVADTSGSTPTVDLDEIQLVTKQGGSVEDTELVEGIVLDDERVHAGMPTRVEDARIALISEALELKDTEIDATVEITDPSQLQSFLDEEERQLREMVETIEATGANVILCTEGIDDLAQHVLAKKGIFAIRRVDDDDLAHVARATGGAITNDIDDLAEADLGRAGTVEQRRVGGDEVTFITDCPEARSVSLLIRGGTEHVTEEAERTLEDAVGAVTTALTDGHVLPGGGAPEIEVALRLREYAGKVGGREQLAIETFADAIEVIPRTLAENAGHDAIDTLVELRNAHESGRTAAGVNVLGGGITDMVEASVFDPLRVKTQAIASATDVAQLILRIDDVIAAKGFGSGDEDEGADLDF